MDTIRRILYSTLDVSCQSFDSVDYLQCPDLDVDVIWLVFFILHEVAGDVSSDELNIS